MHHLSSLKIWGIW